MGTNGFEPVCSIHHASLVMNRRHLTHPSIHHHESPKRWRHRVRNNQLIVSFEAPPQSANALIQTRGKDTVDVAEHRIGILAVKLLA